MLFCIFYYTHNSKTYEYTKIGDRRWWIYFTI